MDLKNFFIIKHGETYSAPCPFSDGAGNDCGGIMKYFGPHGGFKEFVCKKCGEHLLYGGKLWESRRMDEQASRFSSKIIVPERRVF